MTLAKRLEAVEDNLTPQEAVIRWMREAHAFGSSESYVQWLVDQPDESYPLIRMPAQVVAAVRAKNRRVPDDRLRDQFLAVQKDVLYLYFLHKQVEMQALMEKEAIHLRVVILVKEIRALVKEKHQLEQLRLERVNLEGGKHPRPGKVEKTIRVHYEEHAAAWPAEAEALTARILTFLMAARMISRTYFTGEDILYPATREYPGSALETIASLKELYADSILEAPETDDDFRDYVLGMIDAGGPPQKEAAGSPVPKDAPDVSKEAKVLAEQWLVMAKAETLEKLGEHEEAEALSARLAREYRSK